MKARLANLLAQEAAFKKRREALLKAGKIAPTEEDEEAAAAKPGKHHADDGDDDGDEAGEYLGALLQMTQMRAFPNDKVNSAAYGTAIAQRSAMKAATGIGHSGSAVQIKAASLPTTGGAPAAGGSTPTWSYVGPNNLPPPYTTYYGPPASILTGRVNGIAYDQNHPGTVFLVAPGGGVWKSIDYGTNWKPLSDGNQFLQLQASCVAVSPASGNNVLAGMGDFDGGAGLGYSVGIMQSTDAGTTWLHANQPPNTTTNPSLAGQVFSAIKFDPDNPNIVTATAGRGFLTGGIYRSTNGGTNWAPIGVAAGAPAGDWSALTIGTRDSSGNRAYYAALQLDGIYKSTDRGQTWKRVNLTLPLNDLVGLPGGVGLEVAASKVDPNTVYVVDAALVDYALGDGRIFKSTNGGTSWKDVTGNYFDGAAYNDLQQLIVEPGSNWSQCWYDLHATTAAIPTAKAPIDTLYVGGITLSGALTNYSAWTDIGQTEVLNNAITHSDQHSMAIDPTNGNRALFGNDGGIYGLQFVPSLNGWSTLPNGGQTLNKTLGLTQIYHADFAPNNPSVIIMGTQDNASPAAIGDLTHWINPGEGDGAGCAINPLNINIQYNSGYNQDILHTTNLWGSTNPITYYNAAGVAWDGDNLPFIGTMALDAADPNLLFIGTDHLWMWNEALAVWVEHIGGTVLSPNGTVTAIATGYQKVGAAGTDTVAYAGTSDGKLWISTNATRVDYTTTPPTSKATWTEIDTPAGGQPLPLRSITSISVNPHNAFDILVGLSGTGSDHLYRCADTGGGASLTFTDVSGILGKVTDPNNALPDIPLNDVTHDPGDPANTFYVATDIGVFQTIDGGSSWQNATEPLGLPNVQCNVIKAAAGYLNVGTYGRGLWRISLQESPANLVVKTGLSRVNGSIVLTVYVSNTGGLDATNLQVSSANLTVNGVTTSANGIPLNIGTLSPGLSTTVTLTFPGSAGTAGALATISGSLNYTSGTVSIPATRMRLP